MPGADLRQIARRLEKSAMLRTRPTDLTPRETGA